MVSEEELLARILRVAAAFVKEKGEWTMADVARVAGVSRATLYRCVSSRKRLVALLALHVGVGDEGKPTQPMRERILDGIGELVREVPLSRMTLREIAERAGVGEASVYRVFGSRKELLTAYANERSPKALVSDISLGTGEDVRTSLEALAVSSGLMLLEQGPHVLAGLSMGKEGGEDVAHLLALEAEARETLAGWFASKVASGELRGEPTRLVGSLLGLVAGMMFVERPTSSASVEDMAKEAVSLFLDGCLVRESIEQKGGIQ